MTNSATELKKCISSREESLKERQQKEERVHAAKQKKLLSELLALNKRASSILRKAEKHLHVLNDEKSKDELFKFFYWHNKNSPFVGRIGRYFILPIFDITDMITDKKTSFYMGPIVLAWDICTTEISFMFLFDLEDTSGRGHLLTKSIFSLEEISNAKKYELSQEEIDDNRKRFVFFIDKLASSKILDDEEKFLDVLVERYGGASIHHEIKDINFTKSSKEILKFGVAGSEEFGFMPDNLCEESNLGFKALKEMNEFLFDEGYPDFQKIIVDIQRDHFSEKRIERIKTVGWARRFLSNCNGYKELLAKEPNTYVNSIVLHD
jgi:hypothetical protein